MHASGTTIVRLEDAGKNEYKPEERAGPLARRAAKEPR